MSLNGKNIGGRARAVALDAKVARSMARRHPVAILLLAVIAILALPAVAFAADGEPALGDAPATIQGRLTNFIRYLFLPVGIAWASWQIIYLSLVCGVIGIDPLNLLGGNLDQDNVWSEVRHRFVSFAYGLAWVAGIWILFELVLYFVSAFVGIIEAGFSASI